MWGKGLGLVSMKERLEALGGCLQIRSNPAFGTSLEAAVPIGVMAGSEANRPDTTITLHHEIV
jgi:signal transduction histidine kinase